MAMTTTTPTIATVTRALAIAAAIGACTPSSSPEDPAPHTILVRTDPVVPLAVVTPAAAPQPARAPEPEPAPAADPEAAPAAAPALDPSRVVTPKLVVRLRGEADDEGCEIAIEIEHFPAYDPIAQEVVVVERYDRKMSTFDDELIVRWVDATTGAERQSAPILGDHGELSCAEADRRARRRLARVDKRLAEGRWEAMDPVPLRVVNDDAYANLRDAATDRDVESDDVAEFREELMPRGQVHAVLHGGGVMIRLPGVKVYERDLPASGLNTLHAVMAHRPSGVVAWTDRSCRDEDDCTCNLEDETTVMRWSTITLEAIARHPCVPVDESDRCDVASVFDG